MKTHNTPILVAQCKAFHTVEEVSQEIESLLKIHPAKSLNIHVSLPYSYMDPISEKFPENTFQIGAEIMLDTDENSFTGSIAGKLLEEKKVGFIL
ncbi:MAG TPA: triose-phosphate isomerase, partial [Parachlamydiaceae bacterium]|nr:triose-phosphate isomerase [Parachlamydiaceae bacterium]